MEVRHRPVAAFPDAATEFRHAGCPLHVFCFGANFVVDLQDGWGFDIATRRYEHGDLSRLVRAFRRMRPRVFVDVGANMGIYSCIVGSLDPAIRIVALEPDPATFRLLERQIAYDGLQSGTTLIRAAAGASDGQEIGITPTRLRRPDCAR